MSRDIPLQSQHLVFAPSLLADQGSSPSSASFLEQPNRGSKLKSRYQNQRFYAMHRGNESRSRAKGTFSTNVCQFGAISDTF
jgi:hypothetical protein